MIKYMVFFSYTGLRRLQLQPNDNCW